MNTFTEQGHLESIPELNEGLRHRAPVLQKEINHNGEIKNVKQINKLHILQEEVYNNEAEQNEIYSIKPATETTQQIKDNSNRINKNRWTSCDFCNLPTWLQHNDCLLSGHRPPLPSVSACFQSIFRIHTETVNIWTHLLGCIVFIVLAIYSMAILPNIQEKLAIAPFFGGAILCLGFSFIFHTLHCHSPQMLTLFGKLDYCGIALLIMGSFVPWLYFCFNCYYRLKVIYLILTTTLGLCALTVSLLKKFGESSYRPIRAAVFSTFGLSGLIPGVHYLALEGWDQSIGVPLVSITILYILGAALYACRIPERLLPGRCDIWFHSHQVFHILVVIATLINYRGIIDIYNRSLMIKCH